MRAASAEPLAVAHYQQVQPRIARGGHRADREVGPL
jgi:hypothetical protein